MMRSSLKVGRVLGIPILIHITFLLILPVFVLLFGFLGPSTGSELFGLPLGYGDLPVDWVTKVILGIIASIAFFGSVLLHELAHSYVALRFGYKISGITLFIFGGVSQIEEIPPKAPGEARMAFVGPAASFLIGIILVPLALVLQGNSNLYVEIVWITFGLIGVYNILLGAFNIIPAFPMDGGRILRAILARRVGFVRATDLAADIGKAIAIIMGILGIFLNPFLILIAFFIYVGAGEEAASTRITQAMEGIRVGDIMTKQVSTVTPNFTVRELLDKMMVERHTGYPVVEGERVIGMVSLQDATNIPGDQQSITRVANIMNRRFETVSSNAPAMDAFRMVSNRGSGRVPVVDDGRLVGIISRTDLMRTLQIRSAEAPVRTTPGQAT